MSPHHYCLYNDQVLGIGWRREAVLGEVATPAWRVDTSNSYIAMSYIYQHFIQVHFKLHLPLHPSVWLHYIDYLLYIIHFTLSYNMFIHNLCALHNSLSPKSGTSGKLGLHFFPNCCHCIRERKLSWAQTWAAPEISWLFSVPKSNIFKCFKAISSSNFTKSNINCSLYYAPAIHSGETVDIRVKGSTMWPTLTNDFSADFHPTRKKFDMKLS